MIIPVIGLKKRQLLLGLITIRYYTTQMLKQTPFPSLLKYELYSFQCISACLNIDKGTKLIYTNSNEISLKIFLKSTSLSFYQISSLGYKTIKKCIQKCWMVLFQIERLTLRLYFQESPPDSSTAIISQREGKSIISAMVWIKFSI